MIQDVERIRADFDRLAQFSGDGWEHNNHYHGYLLKHLPSRCREALDIGCGSGEFARLLAKRADHVLGIDLSPAMIQKAYECSHTYSNIDYQVRDVLAWEFPPEHFDCIASIATLHHLPLVTILEKMKASLRPGGIIVVLDLFQADGGIDMLRSIAAIPLNIMLNFFHNGHLKDSQEKQAAWNAHGQYDVYPRVAEVREICETVLPGASVRQHLFWRYSIVWQKPDL
jgi:2-polyprenyl-3-methyl-5-hydroxy-6-metoxy-1,4-benzoquinol methylase